MTGAAPDDQSLNCLNCGYDLRSAGEHGKCPECGGRFDRRELQAARSAQVRTRRWMKNVGVSCIGFGMALLLIGWVPLYVYLWLADAGRVPASNLAGGFGPLAWCITPPALMFTMIGVLLLLGWLMKRA